MSSSDRLYNLLPTIYRERDRRLGEPLRAYLATMDGMLQELEDNVAELYENWFVETCAEWVIPYIGDLLGIRGVDSSQPYTSSLRTQVANTLRLRNRKGTVIALSQAVTETTGWPALAVEFFDVIARTQSLNYLRLEQGQTVNVRQLDTLASIGTPFDQIARSVEVRTAPSQPIPSTDRAGKYNIPNIGLFIWRLRRYPVQWAQARSLGSRCFTFNPLGADTPLFLPPDCKSPGLPIYVSDEWPNQFSATTYENNSLALQARDNQNLTFSSTDTAFQLFCLESGRTVLQPIPSSAIQVGDLSRWQETFSADPSTSASNESTPRAIVDPIMGRIFVLNDIDSAQLWVSYTYGFSSDIGGGPYRQVETVEDVEGSSFRAVVSQLADFQETDPSDGVFYSRTLLEALSQWAKQQQSGVIQIADSGTYSLEPFLLGDIEGMGRLQQGKQHSLKILAVEGTCPCIVGDLNLTGCFAGSRLLLSGLRMDGTLTISGTMELLIRNCTLMPSSVIEQLPSIQSTGNGNHLRVRISRSIVGPIHLPEHNSQLSVEDSIIDGHSETAISGNTCNSGGPILDIERSTVIGKTWASEIHASNAVIFTKSIVVENPHEGLIRYSYFPEEESVPPKYQYRCQPALAIEEKVGKLVSLETIRIINRPQFTSLIYGHPGYAQLALSCSQAILTGAENGSEMGVFSNSLQAHRKAHLPNVLQEYLPYGLEGSLFYVD